MIRYSSSKAFLLAPPSVTGDGWQEQTSATSGPQHTLEQKAAALGGTLSIEMVGDDGIGSSVLEIGGKAMPVAYQVRQPKGD